MIPADKRLFDPPVSDGDPDLLWETFHENSKLSMFDSPPSDQNVIARMEQLSGSLEYRGYPVLELPPSRTPLIMPLGEAILRRSTARQMKPAPVSLPALATLLHCAYGITRDQRSLGYPRAFRTVPSGGALYPLEIFVYSAPANPEFDSGLYHFNPIQEHLRWLRKGDLSEPLSQALVQPEILTASSLLIFITAVFERSTFKYGDRGYRFVLIEAGHVGQNINLAAVSLGLGSMNMGGFYDRKLDDFLDLDGLTHSTIYVVAIGSSPEDAA